VKALLAARLFDGGAFQHDRAVLVEGGAVLGIVPLSEVPQGIEVSRLDAASLLTPGFVDVQVNGGGGAMFNDTPDVATLRRIAAAHARLGTTAILPTLISGDAEARRAAISAVRSALTQAVPGIAGLHLEGPFLAPSRRGIHPARAIATPSEEDIAALCAPFSAPLLVTLAPEIVAPAMIRALCDAGRVVFAGHSEASLEDANAGFDAGITGTTHLYNAMSQLTARAPGLVGAALLHGYAGIIVDLLHVDAACIQVAHRTMGPERLFLVSDAMATVGGDATGFVIDDNEIGLRDGRLADARGTLAGAHLCLAEAVRNAVHRIGIPLADALRMATRTPAEAIGLARHGQIAPGSRADFVELDSELAVRAVWLGGEVI
jgi:N-acetylglucosamine-6-phosphate deacetylase